ncbi:hypothetical protein KUTeg_019431 [Tegillarca granosa]|uniref:Uncharacterized protein n=1 Tax=Tegillarca granosa TaxID=220873 RepID=A0ABQ9ECZ0_TEGGR|nr:hypothetical protein KUTeg_019431 [Tegillarca granosa]
MLHALLLRDSIVHSAKLQPLIYKSPSSWQDLDACRKILSKIVGRVNAQLSSCLPCLDKIIQRSSYDRLSIIAANTILTAHNHFSITTDQRVSQTATVLSFWKLLFCFTHPNTRISKELLQGSVDIRLFSSPFEGYLSCCLVKPENKTQCAKQVEKLFVFDIHGEVKRFLQSLPVETSSYLLPVIAHYTGLFIEDTQICKNMSECLSCLSNKVVEYMCSGPPEESKQCCLKCIHLTLKELAAIITMKSSELHLVQKVLDVYLVLCKAINPVKHLRMILIAICSRINEGIYFNIEHSPRPDDDLTLLSNDIPISSSPDNVTDWDHDEHEIIGSPGKFPESMTLNLSNNSGSLPSGRLSSLSQHSEGLRTKSPVQSDNDEDEEDEDSNSDWDSWDEEDKGQSALTNAFTEFLWKLKKFCNIGSSDIFSRELQKLEEQELRLINEMLDA